MSEELNKISKLIAETKNVIAQNRAKIVTSILEFGTAILNDLENISVDFYLYCNLIDQFCFFLTKIQLIDKSEVSQILNQYTQLKNTYFLALQFDEKEVGIAYSRIENKLQKFLD